MQTLASTWAVDVEPLAALVLETAAAGEVAAGAVVEVTATAVDVVSGGALATTEVVGSADAVDEGVVTTEVSSTVVDAGSVAVEEGAATVEAAAPTSARTFKTSGISILTSSATAATGNIPDSGTRNHIGVWIFVVDVKVNTIERNLVSLVMNSS